MRVSARPYDDVGSMIPAHRINRRRDLDLRQLRLRILRDGHATSSMSGFHPADSRGVRLRVGRRMSGSREPADDRVRP